jgi:hypothetical protein
MNVIEGIKRKRKERKRGSRRCSRQQREREGRMNRETGRGKRE